MTASAINLTRPTSNLIRLDNFMYDTFYDAKYGFQPKPSLRESFQKGYTDISDTLRSWVTSYDIGARLHNAASKGTSFVKNAGKEIVIGWNNWLTTLEQMWSGSIIGRMFKAIGQGLVFFYCGPRDNWCDEQKRLRKEFEIKIVPEYERHNNAVASFDPEATIHRAMRLEQRGFPIGTTKWMNTQYRASGKVTHGLPQLKKDDTDIWPNIFDPEATVHNAQKRPRTYDWENSQFRKYGYSRDGYVADRFVSEELGTFDPEAAVHVAHRTHDQPSEAAAPGIKIIQLTFDDLEEKPETHPYFAMVE